MEETEQLGGAEEGPEELASGPDWSQQAAETERILAKLLEEPEEPEEPPKKRKKREDKPPEPKKPARKGWIVNRSTEASASTGDLLRSPWQPRPHRIRRLPAAQHQHQQQKQQLRKRRSK